jgi:hypothetical protein
MAGDWLKMEINTPEKPEVLAITVALGWDDPDLTVGKLFKVWRWFDQHTINGNAKSVSAALLDRLIGVTGLTQAMVNVGWLIVTDDGVSLPNFDRHNGETAKKRALTGKRVAKHKAKQADNADGTEDNAKVNGKGNAGSVNPALPREEKRRVNKTTPIPPKGAKRESAIALKTFLAECKEKNEKPIPEDDSVFDYAEQAGIPADFLRLHWREFVDRYSAPDAKRYKAWRQVFRKSVRGNWFRLWYCDGNSQYALTTVGIQAQNTHDKKREAA